MSAAEATTKNWFDVDRKGLAKLIERRGKIWLLHELIANAWDADGTTEVVVSLVPEDNVPKATVLVTDDSPDGFADLSHAWTLFAESNRKGRADKRGRFNLGEKLVLALCDEASIITTSAGVLFDQRGRTSTRKRRERGSEFYGIARITRAELAEMEDGLRKLIPPSNIKTSVNGVVLPTRAPIATIEATLPTEISDADGMLRRSARKCQIEIYEPLAGETAMLYEMGIPVVDTGDKWHVNITQKVPLNMDRDNVTPAYLREIRTLVVNELHSRLTPEDAAKTFVNEALADADASPEAVNRALDLKYGEKRAIWDPNDLESNMNLFAQGYTLIKGAQLTGEQWTNVRKHGAAIPAGRLAPTKQAHFSPDGKDVWVPEEKWTPSMRLVADYSRELGRELLDEPVTVGILSDITLDYGACFGDQGLVFNLGRLGHKFFNAGITDELNALLIHEFGHHIEMNHLAKRFHDALCKLGAKLARLAITKPEFFKRWGRD